MTLCVELATERGWFGCLPPAIKLVVHPKAQCGAHMASTVFTTINSRWVPQLAGLFRWLSRSCLHIKWTANRQLKMTYLPHSKKDFKGNKVELQDPQKESRYDLYWYPLFMSSIHNQNILRLYSTNFTLNFLILFSLKTILNQL